MYEVEEKFPVADLAEVQSRLLALDAAFSERREEVDLYYAHPSRDFAVTDEALRIRRIGSTGWITYKGPKVDTTTKTRREIELPLTLGEDDGAGWSALLEALGFSPVAEVRKFRRKANVSWQGRAVTATLDEVDGLGTFVEIELMAQADQLDEARAAIASLADALGLKRSERRSYLELLLEGREDSGGS